MATTKIYLDIRGVDENSPAPLKICIVKHGQSAYINLDVRILRSQWDKKAQRVIDAPNKRLLNTYISNRKVEVDNALLELSSKGELVKLNATQIKNSILKHLDPEVEKKDFFINRYKKYADERVAKRTQEIYATTLKKILEYDKSADTLSFEQITKDWLIGFDRFLQNQGLKKNSRNIHMRNIRAVINDAIDNEITTHYPMRNLDINPEETAKRSLSIDELRQLFNAVVPKWQQRYLDYFKLTFYLIGVNPADLCTCTNENVKDGRLIYNRRKTGRLYSIKIEPEALSIINKYKGKRLLVSFTEDMTDYRTFVSRANKALKKIGSVDKVFNATHTKKNKFEYHPMFPHLSIYWARHTWATIAFSIGVPDEMIAAALGHSHGNRTTAIYIDKSIANIDAVNRKVIDYVNLSSSIPDYPDDKPHIP